MVQSTSWAMSAPYLPAVQLVQDDAPPGLYRPPGHMIAVGVADPGGHAYPGLHPPEQAGVVRPGRAPKRPGMVVGVGG